MKKQTLSLLLALALILSFSVVPVFAQNWTEDDVIAYFGAVEDWDSSLLDSAETGFGDISYDDFSYDSKSIADPFAESGTGDYAAKALVGSLTVDGQYIPCGDGKLWVRIVLTKQTPAGMPEDFTYLRSTKVSVNGATATSIKECRTKYGSGCKKIMFDSAGKAEVYGYVYMPDVLPDVLSSLSAPTIDVTVQTGNAPSAAPAEFVTITGNGTATAVGASLCNANIIPATTPAFTGYYEQCGGKAEFKAAIRNNSTSMDYNFVIPGEVTIGGESYANYTCRYTRIGSYGGAAFPSGGDFCKPGERLSLMPNETVQFYITVDELTNIYITVDELTNSMASINGINGGAVPVTMRLGGMTSLIVGNLSMRRTHGECQAKIVPLDPIDVLYGEDTVIKASGPYSVYDNAVAGIYQKCGRFGKFTVTLKNVGVKAGFVKLPAALAVNGGAPVSSFWLSDVAPMGDEVMLAPGQKVTFIGNVYITSVGSQLNSDAPMTAAVNFADLGLYLTGKYYSDRVNWRCNW